MNDVMAPSITPSMSSFTLAASRKSAQPARTRARPSTFFEEVDGNIEVSQQEVEEEVRDRLHRGSREETAGKQEQVTSLGKKTCLTSQELAQKMRKQTTADSSHEITITIA